MRQKTCGHRPRAVEAAARDRDEKIRADLAVGFWFLVWAEFLWSYPLNINGENPWKSPEKIEVSMEKSNL